MKFSLRRDSPPVEVPVGRGEKVLAWCATTAGDVVAGTRDAFYLTGDRAVRVPWEQVEAADWDSDTSTLRLSEVGSWGQARESFELVLDEPRLVVELIRERVTASIVVQRHVALGGRRGLRVIARRAPGGGSPLFWMYEFDEGVDPQDPEVRASAEGALAQLQAEVGLD